MSRAAVFHRAKEPLQLVQRELPAPGPGEVTVNIEACGLGLNDWHVAMLDALPFTPLVPGCEAVGRVEGTNRRVGIGPLATSCGACAACRAGRHYRCAAATWHGFTKNGALCTRGNFAEQHLVPLPDGGDAAELAVLMGSGLAALAAVKAAGPAEKLGVFGLGGLGHLVAQLADRAVYAFEPDPERLMLAKGQLTGPVALDAAIVCVPSAQAIQRAFNLLKPGGRLVLAASSPTGRIDLSLSALTAREVTVVGTHLGGPELLAELLERRPKPVVTRKKLDDAPALLYALRDGGFLGRLVFEPG
ncbi:MAG: alcohol dehydrogenase catalytic domain-containing protein [Myxococcaceae bacterium]|nr:alcohol dehydrogenase catalytic domain-containing protein [Myxococcaceae bacterium]